MESQWELNQYPLFVPPPLNIELTARLSQVGCGGLPGPLGHSQVIHWILASVSDPYSLKPDPAAAKNLNPGSDREDPLIRIQATVFLNTICRI